MQMKKIGLLATSALLAFGLTGCFGTDGDTTETSITISGSSSVKAGNSIALTGGIEASGKITDVEDEFTSEGLSEAELELISVSFTKEPKLNTESIDFEEVGFSIVADAEACNGSYTYTLKATIDSSSTVTKAFNFTVTDGQNCDATALGEAKADTIYNVKGPLKGAYDLKTGTQIASKGDSTVKDLKDMSVANSDDDLFSKEFTSGNGATFAVVTGVDFATVTDKDLTDAAAEATFAAKSGTLSNGDIVLVKLSEARGGALVIVKVITVKDDAVGDNSGYIAFEYKM